MSTFNSNLSSNVPQYEISIGNARLVGLVSFLTKGDTPNERPRFPQLTFDSDADVS